MNIFSSSSVIHCFFVKLPKVAEEQEEETGTKKKLIDFSTLRRPHLLWGVIAQFFYNGGQTAVNLAQPLAENGMDMVRFLMTANIGEALKPMSKVASGGELSRIMLALKNVLAENDSIMTLIFDEVDTGVSGRAAQKVAEKLRSVAKHKQVLCVTHLPQLAAMGDTHLLIAKSERDGRTYTSVTPLDVEGRKKELARIIGGTNITETTLKSAEEMLCF